MRENFEGHRPPSAETEGGAEWTLEKVASVGDLPKDPTNADLVEYGIRNGLLRQGEGIKQLVAKAEQFDPESANILKAVVDANQRAKKGRNTAFTGTMKPKVFSNDTRRPERNPKKFERYAQAEINDMMGAWVMTRGDKKNPMRGRSQAYQVMYEAILDNNVEAARHILSTLGDSGVMRVLAHSGTNPFASLEDRRHTTYFSETHLKTPNNFTPGDPVSLERLKLVVEGKNIVNKVANDSREK